MASWPFRRYTISARARAVDRIGQGIYTDAAELTSELAAVELANAARVCGPVDVVTGTCASRYHDPGCSSFLSSSDDGVQLANSGAYGAAIVSLAQGMATDTGPRVIQNHDPDGGGVVIPARTVELAHRLATGWGLHGDTPYNPAPSWDELTGPVYGARDAYSDMAREVGRDDLARPAPRGGYPGIHQLAQGLGLA